MKKLLDVYKDVTLAISENCDDKCMKADKFAVEIAKLSYSNFTDNHSIRADPPINGVLKDEYRYVNNEKTTPNLNTFDD